MNKGPVEMDKLIAIEQIKQLKARYYRYYDTKDYGKFAACFTLNATSDMREALSAPHGPPPPPEAKDMLFIGRANIEAFVRSSSPLWSVHQGHMPDIEVKSSTTASGIWALEDLVVFPEGGPLKKLHGYGYSYDTYERIDGKWLILSVKVTRLHVELS
jgi:SnoaL-like domain